MYMSALLAANSTMPNHRVASHAPRCLEGRIKRVDYRQRRLEVIGQNQVWYFQVPGDCRLTFDGQQVILRCFHPLDPVKLEFVEDASMPRLLQVAGWEA
jgi:hypothetical protein